MKKIKYFVLVFAGLILCSSCGTVFGGKITTCQRVKPRRGQQARTIRPVVLVFDIIILPGLIVDLIDGGLYTPCGGSRLHTPGSYQNH
jgi:hypothetical protein